MAREKNQPKFYNTCTESESGRDSKNCPEWQCERGSERKWDRHRYKRVTTRQIKNKNPIMFPTHTAHMNIAVHARAQADRERKTKTTNQKLNRKPIETAHAIGNWAETTDVWRANVRTRGQLNRKSLLLYVWNYFSYCCMESGREFQTSTRCASFWGESLDGAFSYRSSSSAAQQFISINSTLWAVNLNSTMQL